MEGHPAGELEPAGMAAGSVPLGAVVDGRKRVDRREAQGEG